MFTNVIEIKARIIAHIFVYKRPMKEKSAGNIGPWLNIWHVMNYMAIVRIYYFFNHYSLDYKFPTFVFQIRCSFRFTLTNYQHFFRNKW